MSSANVTFLDGLLDFGSSVITTTLEESKPTIVSGSKEALANAFGLQVQPAVTTDQGQTAVQQVLQATSNMNPVLMASAAAVATIALVVFLKRG